MLRVLWVMQHILQVLDQSEIWGVRKSKSWVLCSIIKVFCGASGNIVLMGEAAAAALDDYCCHRRGLGL